MAIFIDAANLERSVEKMWVNPKDIPNEHKNTPANELCWRVDYKKLADFFNRLGTVSQLNFYSPHFGSESHNRFLTFLKHAGFKLKTKALKEYLDHTPEIPHRKANFDVELAVDATFTLENYQTFVLFSGDCDFAYLLKFLRGQGKMTIVFSRTGHIAWELPPACHYYFDVADFRPEILRIAPKPSKAKNPAFRRDPAIYNK